MIRIHELVNDLDGQMIERHDSAPGDMNEVFVDGFKVEGIVKAGIRLESKLDWPPPQGSHSGFCFYAVRTEKRGRGPLMQDVEVLDYLTSQAGAEPVMKCYHADHFKKVQSYTLYATPCMVVVE